MLKLFKNFTKKETLLALISVVLIIFQVWLDLKLPDYMSEITLLVQTEGSHLSDIYQAGGMMLLCAFGSLITAVLVAITAARISTNFGANLRYKLFAKVLDFSLEEISLFSTSSLITRSTNDITQIQLLIIMGLQAIVKAPILAFMAITKITGKSWQWSLVTAVAVVVLLIVVLGILMLAMPKFKLLQKLTDRLTHVTRENLTGLRVVRAYNAEAFQENKFEVVNNDLTNTQLFTTRTMAFMMPFIQLVMNGLSLAIYWVGAILINEAGLFDRLPLFSDMIVFSSYAVQIVMAFMMLIMIFLIVPRASVSAKRVLEVLETRPSITDGDIDASVLDSSGSIEFKGVSFKYPDAQNDVLQDINFVANTGETVAFIGATGSGKTTLVNLIPRFYDVTEGEVLLNGINVKDYSQENLHNHIGYAAQKASLFEGTIKSNVLYGQNRQAKILDSDILEALDIAQASEFVESLEGGYDSEVTAGGTNLSGGQKQRLSIARAISRQADVLIFDDSFSALDYRTDRQLRQALREERADKTKLIVAQRIGTIKDADRIIVLDKGRIVGNGRHEELMESCAVYQEIAYSQLTKEELV